MKKPLMGVVVGGVVFFVWGALSWMVFPWNEAQIKGLPQETLITDTMKIVIPEAGVYMFPSGKTPDGQMGDKQQWVEKYKAGPVGFLVYSPGGADAMSPRQFGMGLLLSVLTAAVAVFVLVIARDRVRTVLQRTGVVVILGLGAWLTVHASYWNWFHFPLPYTLTALFDTTLAFAVLGLAVSKFVAE